MQSAMPFSAEMEMYIFWGGLIGWPAAFFILFGLIIWYLKRTPMNARRLRHALLHKIPWTIMGFATGNVEVNYVRKVLPEGVVKIKRVGEKELVPYCLPRPQAGEDGEKVEAVNNLMQKRFTMDGVPGFFGYPGKAVLTNLPALANLEYSGTGNPGKIEIAQSGTVSRNVFFPVDLRSLKTAMPKSWNKSQIKILELTAELEGMLQAKKMFGGRFKEFMPFMVMALLIIAIIVLGALLLG